MLLRAIARRLMLALPVLLGITFLSFLILHLSPGDYFSQLQLNPQIDRQTIERLRQHFGADRPFLVQYACWLKGLLTLDLGLSAAYKAPVSSLIFSRLVPTLFLSVFSILFLWLLALPLGVLCAVKNRSLADHLVSTATFVLMSVPSFFVAFLFVYLSYFIPGLPSGGLTGADFDALSPAQKAADLALHLLLPLAVVVLSGLGPLVRIIKASVLEVSSAPHVTTARAKGVPESLVVARHVLRNALNPLVTILGYQLSGLLSGVALTEAILSWPGLGSLILESVLQHDTLVVMASLLTGSVLLIAGNLLADVLNAWLDPRVQLN